MPLLPDPSKIYIKHTIYETKKTSGVEPYFYTLFSGLGLVSEMLYSSITKIDIHKEDDPDPLPITSYVSSCVITVYEYNSVLDRFFPEEENVEFSGPGTYSEVFFNDPECKDNLFPPTRVPVEVMAKITLIIKQIWDMGYSVNDIHAGNFVINSEGIVKMIDFELISARNPTKILKRQ